MLPDMDSVDETFAEIVDKIDIDAMSIEMRILTAATDTRLVVAIHDELSARLEVLFPYGGHPIEVYEKRHDDAQERTLEIAVNLQHEYGLDEEGISYVLELARRDIEGSGQSFD